MPCLLAYRVTAAFIPPITIDNNARRSVFCVKRRWGMLDISAVTGTLDMLYVSGILAATGCGPTVDGYNVGPEPVAADMASGKTFPGISGVISIIA